MGDRLFLDRFQSQSLPKLFCWIVLRARKVRKSHQIGEGSLDRDHFGQSLLPRVGSFTVTTVHRAFACANHRNLRSGDHLVEVQTLPHFSLLHGLTTNLYHEGAAFPLSPRG